MLTALSCAAISLLLGLAVAGLLASVAAALADQADQE